MLTSCSNGLHPARHLPIGHELRFDGPVRRIRLDDLGWRAIPAKKGNYEAVDRIVPDIPLFQIVYQNCDFFT